MADNPIPHFHNDIGVEAIGVGVKELMCMGALPPFDHPHVYLDMGRDTETVCSYCSTLFRFRPELKVGESDPPGLAYLDVVI